MMSASRAAAKRIPSLDGIRAASLMLVFAAHAGYARQEIGAFGVNVFFFLSGFLITTLLRLEYETKGSVNIAYFWLRRALRVLPPFYVVALGATAIGLILYPPGTVYASSLIAELFFYFAYYSFYGGVHPVVPGIGVAWSLAVEEHFYLLFPLLFMAMQKWLLCRPHRAWILWGLCAASLAWRCVLVFHWHFDINRIYPATDTRIDSILFGCALAVWNNPYVDHVGDPSLGSGRWKYIFLPAAVAGLLGCVLYDNPVFQNTVSFSLQGLALNVIFIAAVRFHDWLPFKVLNCRPVVFIGTLSYSLYLVHDVSLRATIRLWPFVHQWQHAAIALTASFVAALAIYLAIEKPCALLRKKISDQPARPGASSSRPLKLLVR
ncbi:MAG TPA: acyltransferase [Steroidobacteraceae bacterium]